MDTTVEIIQRAMDGDENAIESVLKLTDEEIDQLKRLNYDYYEYVLEIRKKARLVKNAIEKLDKIFSEGSLADRYNIVATSDSVIDVMKKWLYVDRVDEATIRAVINTDGDVMRKYLNVKNAFEEDKEKLPREYERYITAPESEIRELDSILYDLDDVIVRWNNNSYDEWGDLFEDLLEKYERAKRFLEQYNMPPENVLMMRNISYAYAFFKAKEYVDEYSRDYEEYRRLMDEAMHIVDELESIARATDVVNGEFAWEEKCGDNEACAEEIKRRLEEYRRKLEELERVMDAGDRTIFIATLRKKIEKKLGVPLSKLRIVVS